MLRPPTTPPVPPDAPPPGPVTVLLQQAADDRIPPDALIERLMPVVYDELRQLARVQRRKLNQDAFQTTALVHEAYLRMAGRDLVPEKAYVFAAASRAMRNVLVDHARRRHSLKRGDAHELVPLDAVGDPAEPGDVDAQTARVLDVDAALRRLEDLAPRAAKVAECRYFGGLSGEETAVALGISRSTAIREWRRARAWLHGALAELGENGAARDAPGAAFAEGEAHPTASDAD